MGTPRSPDAMGEPKKYINIDVNIMPYGRIMQ
jgi:hypothetical protein